MIKQHFQKSNQSVLEIKYLALDFPINFFDFTIRSN